MAKGSIENVLTVLHRLDVRPYDYDVHVNFPGGVPVDGPSAGVTIAIAIYSAIKEKPVDNYLAVTGEVSIHGKVKPVGGVVAKVEAAKQAGAKRVLIPQENWQSIFADMKGIEVIPVTTVQQAIQLALVEPAEEEAAIVASFAVPVQAEELASSTLSL
jgi:Lon-like ATP-dependent protease